MNRYYIRVLLIVFMASSSLPAHAGWLTDMGSYISSTVSGWFLPASAESKKVLMVAAGAITLGLGAYIVYSLFKKRRGGNPPEQPGDRPDNPPQPPIIPVGPPQPPIQIVIDHVEQAPRAVPVVPIAAPQAVAPCVAPARIPDVAPRVVPSHAAEEKNKRDRVEKEQKEKEAQGKELQEQEEKKRKEYVVQPVAPVVPETPTIACPGGVAFPSPYLSWQEQAGQERKIKEQGSGTTSGVPENPAGLQVEDKVSAAELEELTKSQEWEHVFAADAPLPESPKDLIEAEKKDLVEKGYVATQKVLDGEKNELTEDEVRSIMWYMWHASVPNAVSELTFKIEDTPDRRLYNALLRSKDETGKSLVYERMSSHFPKQIEGGKHYGINIEGLPLPEKTTIVFAPLINTDETSDYLGENTTFYIKPEDHGCENPLTVWWEQGLFKALSASTSMLLHGYQYIYSNVGATVYADFHGGREKAKERTTPAISQAWLACLPHVECSEDLLKKYKEFADLKKGAVFKMNAAIGTLKAKANEEDALAQKQKEFTAAFAQEYPGDRLKYVGVLNGREIFHPLPQKKSRPMLVDLEAGEEAEAKQTSAARALVTATN